MDLLGDLGAADQLTSERAENKLLKQKVKDLTEEVQKLRVENQSLLAEVERYRADAIHSVNFTSFSKTTAAGDGEASGKEDSEEMFISSGDGIYPCDPAVTLPSLHGSSNPLCCALNHNDTVLATGGADRHISLCAWGSALSPAPDAAQTAVKNAARVRCEAPVISIAMSSDAAHSYPLVAAGCMDGTVQLASYDTSSSSSKVAAQALSLDRPIQHTKYVRSVAFAPSSSILASSSADGTVRLTKITSVSSAFSGDYFEKASAETQEIKTLHLSGAVEAMCFLEGGKILCCYVRNTSYLSYFDLEDGCKLTKYSLNGSAPTGGFDDHVSFAVMDLAPSPDGKYIAAATDTSRQIILESSSSRQIRNLYGHKNDGFSQPKLAWSTNGQYILGNTQEDNSICVWDIASSSIVKRLNDKTCNSGGGAHTGQIRDLYSSSTSNTFVTASYDKTVKVWLQGM
mmetsp:Transcript_7125/g.10538  ORF Transcript_7125/g.10538 Transcript_7125/m.10538 type:complete len:457 (-) Transcript_7125:595-1965(-)